EMVDVAMPGARTAVNLHGVTAEQVTRGQTLVRHGPLRAHSRFGVRATSLGDAGFSGRNPQHLTLHHGTRSCAAELRVVAEDDRNGQPAVFAELRTTVPLVVLPGDRFLLRATSADQTVGGGVILDAAPPARRRSRSDIVDDLTRRGDGLAEDVLLAEVSRAAHGLRVDEARMLTGL